MPDQERYTTDDLVLKVSTNIDPTLFDISVYEPFIDALCGTREYQKTAIRTVLRYLLGGRYANLQALAQENFAREELKARYGTWAAMQRALPLPDQLACSVDLATATGKSFVMYAIARIMLAHGAVDRVLVLCPSTTIEQGLISKFRQLSTVSLYTELLPEESHVRTPHIIDASESIVEGTICIENDDAILQRVRSSIRDSLAGKGERTLVLNDEVHHVYNGGQGKLGRWKQFLLDQAFGFHYIVGFSGTCYEDNDYFSDVVSRYSLRDAMEQGYAKTIDYTVSDTLLGENEAFQKIYSNHVDNKVKYHLVKPLTILVTRDVEMCKQLTRDFTAFLMEREGITEEQAAEKVLLVTSAPEHKANVRRLPTVDQPGDPVEWITSVSMLTEGWDVQNVFQVVPHEARAFNSKLLIAQVLGRGLRIPEAYRGERMVVTVYNHASWSRNIAHLVDEVMEKEKRIASYPVAKPTDHNFTLDHINYTRMPEVTTTKQENEYVFSGEPVKLVSQLPMLDRETTYTRATTGEQRLKKTQVRYTMFTVDEVAHHLHAKFRAIDVEKGTHYGDRYSFAWLKDLIQRSLREIGETSDQVSAENRQSLQKAFGVVHRDSNQSVRYRMNPGALYTIETSSRHKNEIGITALRHADATVFLDDQSLQLSDEATREVLELVLADYSLPRSAIEQVTNTYNFKTPVNVVLTSRRPEREFVQRLLKPENAAVLTAWLKSTDTSFYSVSFSWRRPGKGGHSVHSSFNPDFFLKIGNHIIVVEIKGDEQLQDPEEENKAKYKAAREHFERLNSLQSEREYHFLFLTPVDYDGFFQFIRNGNYNYASRINAVLSDYVGERPSSETVTT